MKPLCLLTAGAALLWGSVVAAPAAAATTIGVVSPGAPAVKSDAGVAFSPIPAYTVPSPGVITSWTVNAGAVDWPAYVAMKLLRTTTDPSTGNLTATVVATTKLFGTEEGLTTHVTRIPVTGGEHLGVRFPESGLLFPSGAESSACSARDRGAVGAAYREGQTLTCVSGSGVNISAKLEPDEDGDGFGDESQDRCLRVAGPATGCRSRYRGHGAGLPVEFRFGTRQSEGRERERPLTAVVGNRYGVRAECPDGYKTAFLLVGGVTGERPVMVRPNGDFKWASGIAKGRGVVKGRVEIDGHLVGPRAHGTIEGQVELDGHGTCVMPRYFWRIRA